MQPTKMHVDEVETDTRLVQRLLAAQFPQWSTLPIKPVRTAGTDHALYRLGADMVARLPRIQWATGQAERESQWLPRLAPNLPLTVSGPLEMGNPGAGYPWRWAVYRWLEGESANPKNVNDLVKAAKDIAQFITALQGIDATGGPVAGRGVPLATRDAATSEAIAALAGMIDTKAMMSAWEAALLAREWTREPVWVHGDLLPGNVLVERGQVSAVIDFGGLGVGDPACDLMIAWSLFSGESRNTFRQTLAVDDATWQRGRGWALSQAAIFIPYYLETNPGGVANARRTIHQVLTDAS